MATHDILLPISIDDGLKMDAAEAKALGSMLAEDYRSAEPFPHIVLDNFLPDALVRRMVEHFPQEALQSEVLQAYERWSDLDARARRRVERE